MSSPKNTKVSSPSSQRTTSPPPINTSPGNTRNSTSDATQESASSGNVNATNAVSQQQQSASNTSTPRPPSLSRTSSNDSSFTTSAPSPSHMRQSHSNTSLSSMGSQSQTDTYPKVASEYALQYLIAEGPHGNVYYATVKKTHHAVAFKIIDLDSLKDVGIYAKTDAMSSSHLLSDIIREIAILKKCRHENVIELKTAFVHKSNICLIMEYFEGGTLQDILKQPQFKHGLRDEDLIACILKQILKGLHYCHQNDILHRDLKASNVLINKEGVCKLADFAFSGELTEGGEKKRVRHTFVGSSHWMAPEVMAQAGVGYNQSADIWSFGITALELANGRTPTEDFSELKVYLQTIEGPSPSLNEDLFKNYTKSFRDLISPCLEKDPKKRPSAAQLLKHPFFKRTRQKGKEYIKEKLMSSVPEKKGKPVSSDDPLRSVDEDKPSSLEWDFDRDKFLAEKNKDTESQQSNNGGTAPSTPASSSAIQRTTSPKPQEVTSDTGSVKSHFSAALADGNETGSILSMDQEDLLTFEEEKLAEEQAMRERGGNGGGSDNTSFTDFDDSILPDNHAGITNSHSEDTIDARSPTKLTEATPFQTSPQQEVEQRLTRAGSRASLPDKSKPEVEKHGRFEMSTIKKKPKKANGTKAKTGASPGVSAPATGTGTTAAPTTGATSTTSTTTTTAAQTPSNVATAPPGTSTTTNPAPTSTASAAPLGEDGSKVKRPFEISDVTDPSEIPGHAKGTPKVKPKPTIETLERKVNVLMKKIDHHQKNLLDIREICKANHEMIQHFYNHTLSTSIMAQQQQQDVQRVVPNFGGANNAALLGGDSLPQQAPPMPAPSVLMTLQQFDQQMQYTFHRQRQLELENAQMRRELEEYRALQGGASLPGNRITQQVSGAPMSSTSGGTGSTVSCINTNMSSLPPPTAAQSPQLPGHSTNAQAAPGAQNKSGGPAPITTDQSTTAPLGSPSPAPLSKNTPNRASTDSRSSTGAKASASESLDQLVLEQLNRGNPSLKKSTLNEIRRSTSQMFLQQQNQQVSPTNSSSNGGGSSLASTGSATSTQQPQQPQQQQVPDGNTAPSGGGGGGGASTAGGGGTNAKS